MIKIIRVSSVASRVSQFVRKNIWKSVHQKQIRQILLSFLKYLYPSCYAVATHINSVRNIYKINAILKYNISRFSRTKIQGQFKYKKPEGICRTLGHVKNILLCPTLEVSLRRWRGVLRRLQRTSWTIDNSSFFYSEWD